MQKMILIVVGILVVIGIVLIGSRGYSQQEVNETAVFSTDENNIVYTSTGFSPKTLVVEVGITVVFENESARSMWVASNPHPVHTGLRGFDAKSGSSQGGSYSYTFTESGKFGYHNHLSPSDTGIIEVK